MGFQVSGQSSGSALPLSGGHLLETLSPLSLGPPAPGLAQACPAQMLVGLNFAFLPPPPLPAVAKLRQKIPSASCELFHFHDFPGGRKPSG